MPRIVGLQEFGNLPDGVVYSHTNGHGANGLYRRGTVIRSQDGGFGWNKGDVTDFFELDLLGTPDNNAWDPKTQEFPPFDPPGDSWCRWGCFEDEAKFLVYDEADVQALIENLTRDVTGKP